MSKLRIAMIGCGRIGEMYKEVFKTIGEQVEVAYAVDTKPERAEEFSESFPQTIENVWISI